MPESIGVPMGGFQGLSKIQRKFTISPATPPGLRASVIQLNRRLIFRDIDCKWEGRRESGRLGWAEKSRLVGE